MKRQTEENKFALIQFTKLLWNTAVRLNRSRKEWQADVWSVFKGFDPTNSGNLILKYKTHTHTHTHIYIYVYIYIYTHTYNI